MENYDAPKYDLPAYRPLTNGSSAWTTADNSGQPWEANGRWLAALVQVKDTINIILMLCDGTLLVGIVCGFGIPGLVFYALRWRQVRRRVGRKSKVVLAILSLAHEVFWACLFQKEAVSQEPIDHASVLAKLYWLGAGLNALLLLVALLAPARPAADTTMSADENQAVNE